MNLNQLFGNQPKKNFALHEVILRGGDRISRWHMIFLVSSGKMTLLFLKNMMFFSRRKVKDDLSQKIRGNMVFSVYSVKVVFLFSTNMKLHFCQKSKDYLLPKNILKNDICGITKKGDTHPRKDDIGILD